MILRDCQLRRFGESERSRAINFAAFSVCEAVRLDVHARRVRAPFAKICITLQDRADDGRVNTALNMCEVSITVDFETLHRSLPAVADIIAYARRGLRAVERSRGSGTSESIEF
jgi:hypothetical protein